MRETLRYAWGMSSLGEFIAASSDRGLVTLEFAQREASLTSALRSRYPEAELVEDSTGLKETVERAASLIEHPGAGRGVPVDMTYRLTCGQPVTTPITSRSVIPSVSSVSRRSTDRRQLCSSTTARR